MIRNIAHSNRCQNFVRIHKKNLFFKFLENSKNSKNGMNAINRMYDTFAETYSYTFNVQGNPDLFICSPHNREELFTLKKNYFSTNFSIQPTHYS